MHKIYEKILTNHLKGSNSILRGKNQQQIPSDVNKESRHKMTADTQNFKMNYLCFRHFKISMYNYQWSKPDQSIQLLVRNNTSVFKMVTCVVNYLK